MIATGAATLYLGFMTIPGNLVSTGGGDPGRNLPGKDIAVDGNLIVQGWSGLWLGIIRDTVGRAAGSNGLGRRLGECAGL